MLLTCLVFSLISTVADLRNALLTNQHDSADFAVTGTITALIGRNLQEKSDYVICQDGAYCILHDAPPNLPRLSIGDVVEARGKISKEMNGGRNTYVRALNHLGTMPVPPPMAISSIKMLTPETINRNVKLTGLVVDIIEDGIDPRWKAIILQDDFNTFFAMIPKRETHADIDALIGSVVSISGTVIMPISGKRHFLQPYILLNKRSDIYTIRPAPADPFDVPIADLSHFVPLSTAMKASRMRTSGIVIASWNKNKIMLLTTDGHSVQADFAARKAPSYGDRVSIVGFPTTDLVNINLTHALWKTDNTVCTTQNPPVRVTSRDLLSDKNGTRTIHPEFNGRLVRIQGQLTSEPVSGPNGWQVHLADANILVTVNVDSCLNHFASIPVGSTVEITGVGVLNAEVWHPSAVFPRINDLMVVARSFDDVTIVRRPPWLTIGKLIGVIGALLVVLMVIFIWNRILQRIVRRRSNELARIELDKAVSDLRINERTRLAVDIHDSISQTLTGVSFQIDAAEKTVGKDDTAALGFLVVARRTLASCREELRRCLWDLRNNAIGEPNFGKAIELVLQPYAKTTSITVRFNVPRTSLTDSTAHNILSIVRELTVNAIRHGKATHVRIAGEKREGVVRFSVTDDGIGFDPDRHPGIDDGHFGLQGIRERLNHLGNGKLSITSTHSKGTKAIVEIGK